MKRLSSLSLGRMLARAADGEVCFKLGPLEVAYSDVTVLGNQVVIILDSNQLLSAINAALQGTKE